MVAENDDERYNGISMEAAARKSLTPEYQRLLDE